MSDASEEDAVAVTVRLDRKRAFFAAGKVLGLLLLCGLGVMVVRAPAERHLVGIPVMLLVTVGMISLFREVTRVTISREGIQGFGGKVVPWTAISSLEKASGGFVVKSTSYPGVPVATSIAEDGRFKDAVVRWCPEGNELRELVLGAQSTR